MCLRVLRDALVSRATASERALVRATVRVDTWLCEIIVNVPQGGLKPGLQPCVPFRGQTSPQVAFVQYNEIAALCEPSSAYEYM